jgi:NADH-quinone oxidoreductase subunit M
MAIKIPIVPFHIWLPEAHVEASTEGSIILAGLLLKIGLFGIVRFLLPCFFLECIYFSPLVYTINIITIIYISFSIFIQMDVKKIIAYSSIIHMNFVSLGFFSGTLQGVVGGIYLMFTHGFVSSGLFLIIGFLYTRYSTRLIHHYGGLQNYHPMLASFFFLFSIANFGFPGTGGFVGEFLILIGVFQKNYFIGVIALFGVFLSAIYSLLLFTRIFFGISNKNNSLICLGASQAITHVEFYLLSFIGAYIIFSGLFPNIYLNFLEAILIKSILCIN